MTTALDMEAPARLSANELLPVAGVSPLTTVDFPSRLALTVFTQGCPWRCGYCHNAALRPLDQPTSWRWRRVCELLEERRGFLEAVVFSGGEPTLHRGLEAALRTVRGKDLLTGLHTAGVFPDRLRLLLPWIDWVGLDVKAPLDKRYAQLTGDGQSAAKVLASLELLRAAGVPLQLRTTVGPGALSEQAFDELRRQLRALGAPEPIRQEVRPVRADGPPQEPCGGDHSASLIAADGSPGL
ncbi:MAG TPA: anaerobic ribonucleoside-triphosphate reductase activating protein [Candidatus Paceibacterota bacterium]|nr:anaerobic ribonucleoside-triphosphate reductase activating protein [Verrucomicrobiota bacterium]HSA09095.1 anaerobic ribonucleoside-triphosphate reductase activating protein [Candidatus Paceibacterota bacterium]